MTEIAIGYSIPESQRLQYSITPLDGQLMNAESIGGQLVAIAELLRVLANQDDSENEWMVGVVNIETSESGVVSFELMLAPKIPGDGNGIAAPDDPSNIAPTL